MRKTNANKILRRAYELLDRPYGWTKGQFKRRNKRVEGGYSYCALGAIRQATFELKVPRKFEDQARRQVHKALKEQTGRISIFVFNDRRTTKKKDVLDLLEKAME